MGASRHYRRGKPNPEGLPKSLLHSKFVGMFNPASFSRLDCFDGKNENGWEME